jgi:phosphoglycerate dehydrogenase-like enzyme
MVTIVFWLTHPEVASWNLNEAQVGKLKRELAHKAEIRFCFTQAAFLAALPEAGIAVLWSIKQEWFELAPCLKRLVTPSAGKDHLNAEPPAHIKTEFSSFHGELMAETALGMLLCQARGIIKAYTMQTSHAWPRTELSRILRPLRGSRVTIWGFGHIGEWIARLAKPLGVSLYGVKRIFIPAPAYFEQNDRIITLEAFDSILPETDHLIVCLPNEAATNNQLNADRLKLLPKHAAIYNLGRGNVLDEVALVKALEEERLAAAYLDVFQQEPLPPDSPLRTCKNCYLMPHASAIAPNYLDLFIDEFLVKCKNWLQE